MVQKGNDPLAKSPDIGGASIQELPCTNISLSERLRTSKDVPPPRPQKHLLAVAHRKCKTHDRQPRLHSNRRPWDAWEQKSLKKLREIVGERSTCSSGYSRGPELLKAMEMLKNRSHS